MDTKTSKHTQSGFLLLEDVDSLGLKGEVVKVKPGYARNFLLPKKLAVIASVGALQMQAKLKDERAKKGVEDKVQAEALVPRIEALELTKHVKVDHEGHMYGSVSVLEIVHLLEKEGIVLERKNLMLPHAIKQLGEVIVGVKLKEGVTTSFKLQIVPEAGAHGPNNK